MPGHAVNPQTGDVTLSTAPVGPAARDRLVTPAFIRLAVADLAYFTAAGVAIYALPLWVTGPVGSDKSGAGLAFGAFAVSALILRPVAGRLADTRGRRPLLVGGALISALGMIGTAYADNLVLVVLLRLLLGVAEAAFFVASLAALADLAPPSRIGEATSYNSLGLYLGLAFGPPLGELLVISAGYTAAWYGAAALSLIAACGRGRDQERPVTLCTDERSRPADPLEGRPASAGLLRIGSRDGCVLRLRRIAGRGGRAHAGERTVVRVRPGRGGRAGCRSLGFLIDFLPCSWVQSRWRSSLLD